MNTIRSIKTNSCETHRISGLTYSNLSFSDKNPSSSTRGNAQFDFEVRTERTPSKVVRQVTGFNLSNDNGACCIAIDNVALSKETIKTIGECLLKAAESLNE